MDWKAFIANIVGSLAWPGVVFALIIIFRVNLRTWIQKLLDRNPKQVSIGTNGVTFLFDEVLGEAKEEKAVIEAETEAPLILGVPDSLVKSFDEMTKLAKITPSAAVLESFRRLESMLRDLLYKRKPDIDIKRLGGRRLARVALGEDIISSDDQNLFNDLASMRNFAAHGDGEIDYDRAMEFAKLADFLMLTWHGRNSDLPDNF